VPYDVYALADGQFERRRRGGYEFHVRQPVRLTDEQLTEEIREDAWLVIVPVDESAAADPDFETLQAAHLDLMEAYGALQAEIATLRAELDAIPRGITPQAAPEAAPATKDGAK
jgi:hypothetical protein